MQFDLTTATDLLVLHSRYLVYSHMSLTKEDSEESIPINMVEDKENEYIRIGTKGCVLSYFFLISLHFKFSLHIKFYIFFK